MKTTQYFDYTRKRPDRAQAKEDWIKSVVEKPDKAESNLMAGSGNGPKYQKQKNI